MREDERTHPSFLLRLRDHEDRVSWQDFSQQYGHMLYRYARARGAGHADAEDIVQEVQMQFFKAIDGFQYDARKGRFHGYLRSAVVHAMSRRAQRASRQLGEFNPAGLDAVAAEREAREDDRWEFEWRLHMLRRAVQSIAGEFDPTVLKAFEMHALAGRPADETGEELGLSKWGVYRAKNRILDRIKQRLAEWDTAGDG